MAFGCKRECARLKEKLVEKSLKLEKAVSRAEKAEKTLREQWARNDVLRDQYAHKALQYDTLLKKYDSLVDQIESECGDHE